MRVFTINPRRCVVGVVAAMSHGLLLASPSAHAATDEIDRDRDLDAAAHADLIALTDEQSGPLDSSAYSGPRTFRPEAHLPSEQTTTRLLRRALIGTVIALLLSLTALAWQHVRLWHRHRRLRQLVGRLKERSSRRLRVHNDLVKAKTKAEAANKAQSAFLASVSHEIRTPMNGILGFTEILLSSGLTPTQREHVEIVDQSSKNLLTLINDILDISQLEAGAFKIRNGAFDLHQTAERTVRLLQARARDKDLHLTLDIDDDVLAQAYGDAHRLQQILLNLVGNAVKFTNEGGVSLRVRCADHPSSARFEVQDTGPGISPSQQTNLFERFSQGEAAFVRQHKGSGLGLAICRELVIAMGGTIGCQSREGQGSVFVFTLPLWSELFARETPVNREGRQRLREKALHYQSDSPNAVAL